ncbi:MAG: inorganic phosphate transporter [Gemmataceae bacterium]
MTFWDALGGLTLHQQLLFAAALVVAFGFEFINGFHDTANAVATVIYTRTLPPTPAVLYSGVMNFLGVLLGGTGVAFSIVHLLPVDLLVETGASNRSLVMVLSLLLAGVFWNLGTWYIGLPVSSSHTLIGAILGVGLANTLAKGVWALNTAAVTKVGLALLLSPLIGFTCSALLLLVMKRVLREPRLYVPPNGDDGPPWWVRLVLVGTCGGVSYAHGSNDGQKGMGLILLVLIGFLPFHYALDTNRPDKAHKVAAAAAEARKVAGPDADPGLAKELDFLAAELAGKGSFEELPLDRRWEVRQSLMRANKAIGANPELAGAKKTFTGAMEFVPLWVVAGVAVALGVGTTVGYKRIVVTVAERIGKSHLSYAQGAAAELVAAATIFGADYAHLPVSTTQVVSSGIAGTMAANGNGVQPTTVRRILLAWVLTLPATMILSGSLYLLGRQIVG